MVRAVNAIRDGRDVRQADHLSQDNPDSRGWGKEVARKDEGDKSRQHGADDTPPLLDASGQASLISGQERAGLKEKVASTQDFQAFAQQTYGQDLDDNKVEDARHILSAWMNGNASVGEMPKVSFLSDQDMKGAKGAYFSGDDMTPETIFLNSSLLGGAKSLEEASPEAQRLISATATEELGHALEARLRPAGQEDMDTPGDEGAGFVYELTGDEIAQARIGQDDAGEIYLDERELAVELLRSDPGVSILSVASSIHDAVRTEADDAFFNDSWAGWNLTPQEKTQVFETLRNMHGGADYLLNAKAGRKFTQPISEFAQYVTANYGGYMGQFITGRGNDWDNNHYELSYANWIAPAENSQAFYDYAINTAGFDHWGGLDGTRSDMSLPRSVFQEGMARDKTGVGVAATASSELAGAVDKGDGGPSDADFEKFYQKYVGGNPAAADNLALAMSRTIPPGENAPRTSFWLDASHGRKFTSPINEFAQWAAANKPADLASHLFARADEWSDGELNLVAHNWTAGAPDSFYQSAASLQTPNGASDWLTLPGTRSNTGAVAGIVQNGIRLNDAFADQVASHLWTNVQGGKPAWDNDRIAQFMGTYVTGSDNASTPAHDANQLQMSEAMLRLSNGDPAPWTSLHGTRSTATANGSPTIADTAQLAAVVDGVQDAATGAAASVDLTKAMQTYDSVLSKMPGDPSDWTTTDVSKMFGGAGTLMGYIQPAVDTAFEQRIQTLAQNGPTELADPAQIWKDSVNEVLDHLEFTEITAESLGEGLRRGSMSDAFGSILSGDDLPAALQTIAFYDPQASGEALVASRMQADPEYASTVFSTLEAGVTAASALDAGGATSRQLQGAPAPAPEDSDGLPGTSIALWVTGSMRWALAGSKKYLEAGGVTDQNINLSQRFEQAEQIWQQVMSTMRGEENRPTIQIGQQTTHSIEEALRYSIRQAGLGTLESARQTINFLEVGYEKARALDVAIGKSGLPAIGVLTSMVTRIQAQAKDWGNWDSATKAGYVAKTIGDAMTVAEWASTYGTQDVVAFANWLPDTGGLVDLTRVGQAVQKMREVLPGEYPVFDPNDHSTLGIVANTLLPNAGGVANVIYGGFNVYSGSKTISDNDIWAGIGTVAVGAVDIINGAVQLGRALPNEEDTHWLVSGLSAAAHAYPRSLHFLGRIVAAGLGLGMAVTAGVRRDPV